MDEMFGLSMNVILYVLLGILGVCLCSVLYVLLRNRIMFQMGVRNIPRRAAQTVLIVLGQVRQVDLAAAARDEVRKRVRLLRLQADDVGLRRAQADRKSVV